jgi:DNA-directed RNA polymerase II subunit RPB1
MSEVDITVDKLFEEDGTKKGKPTRGGLLDRRMGASDREDTCNTCHANFQDCPGHFGRIKLEQSVFHPGYLTKVYQILCCVCFNCGKLRKEDLWNKNSDKYQEITRIRKNTTRFKKILEIS